MSKSKTPPKPKTMPVKKVALGPKAVVRIVSHKDVLPVVVHKAPGVIEIAPAPKQPIKQKRWWDFFLN